MSKKVILLTSLIVILLLLAIVYTVNVKSLLFHDMPFLMLATAAIGILSGIWRGVMDINRLKRVNLQSERHTIDSFLEHWGTATGILLLMLSGLFIEVGYQRFFSKNLHFLGLIMMLYFGTYFLAHFFISKKYRNLVPNFKDIIEGTVKNYLFRTTWNDTDKYLSSQKSSFMVFAILGMIIFLSGTIKVFVYYFGIPMQLLIIATRMHDITAVLFALMVLIHLLITIFVGEYRRLLPSFFTGKIKER
jgi:cytochrome b subunit of formate dehydrogenase